MSLLSIILSMKMANTINPNSLAILILSLSILVSSILFKITLSSWLAFVLILTFSSGMMTLFLYATSLSPNEKTKSKKNKLPMILLLTLTLGSPLPTSPKMKESMKTFSNQSLLLIMTLCLILTMVAIISHGFNPNQTVSSSF